MDDKYSFIIRATYVEVYNEEIYDLLSAQQDHKFARSKSNTVSLREEKDGSIIICGVREERIDDREQLYLLLEQGSDRRSVGSTKMNDESSRSHAILTLIIEKSSLTDDKDFVCARFSFVDLAGSERLGRTEAVGKSMKEGININKGLLALGNVISALTDDTGKVSFIPYRVSKLTRILRNSLGGNSRTWMIACVSPVLADLDESLNTIKYATRARKISNTPIINKDPQSAVIAQLKQQVFRLQTEMQKMKKVLNLNGISPSSIEAEDLDLREESLKAQDSPARTKYDEGLDPDQDAQMRKMQTEILKLKEERNKAKKDLNERNTLYWRSLERASVLRKQNEELIKLIGSRESKAPEDSQQLPEARDRATAQVAKIMSDTASDELLSLNKELEDLKRKLSDKSKYASHLEEEYTKLLRVSTRENELLVEKIKDCEQLKLQLKLNSTSHSLSRDQHSINRESLGTGSHQASGSILPVWEQDESELADKLAGLDSDIHKYREEKEKHEEELKQVLESIHEKEQQLKQIEDKHEEDTDFELPQVDYNNLDRIVELEREKEELLRQLKEKPLLATQPQEKGHKKRLSSTQPTKDPPSDASKFKQKIAELEAKISDLCKKGRDSKEVEAKRKEKSSKVEGLQSEMQKLKAQKLDLEKKLREGSETFTKTKVEKDKELFGVKKQLFQKITEIEKLKTLTKKQDLIFQKKLATIKASSLSKPIKFSKKNTKAINSTVFEQIDTEGFSQIVELICHRIFDYAELQNEIKQQTHILERIYTKHGELLTEICKVEAQKLMSNEKKDFQDELMLLEAKQTEFQSNITSCDAAIEMKQQYLKRLEDDHDKINQFINEGFASLLNFLLDKSQDNTSFWETTLNIMMYELEKLKAQSIEQASLNKKLESESSEDQRTIQEFKKTNASLLQEVDRYSLFTRLHKFFNEKPLSASNHEDSYQTDFLQQSAVVEAGEAVFSRTLNFIRKRSDKHDSINLRDSRKLNIGALPQSQEFSKLKNELLKAHIKNENLMKILKEKEKEQLWSQASLSQSNPNTRNDLGDSLRKSLKGVRRSTNIGSLIINNAMSVGSQGIEAADSPTFAIASPRPSLPGLRPAPQSGKKRAILESDSSIALRGSREGSKGKPSRFAQHENSSSRNRTVTTYDFKSSFAEDDFNLYDHSFHSSNFTFK